MHYINSITVKNDLLLHTLTAKYAHGGTTQTKMFLIVCHVYARKRPFQGASFS
jgi:hypothetical protein